MKEFQDIDLENPVDLLREQAVLTPAGEIICRSLSNDHAQLTEVFVSPVVAQEVLTSGEYRQGGQSILHSQTGNRRRSCVQPDGGERRGYIYCTDMNVPRSVQ